MINLIKIKNDFSGYIKSFGYFYFFCWLGAFLFFLLALGALADDSMNIDIRKQIFQTLIAISTIIEMIPILVLGLLFIETNKRLSKQKV